jgi:hypothetical protein
LFFDVSTILGSFTPAASNLANLAIDPLISKINPFLNHFLHKHPLIRKIIDHQQNWGDEQYPWKGPFSADDGVMTKPTYKDRQLFPKKNVGNSSALKDFRRRFIADTHDREKIL